MDQVKISVARPQWARLVALREEKKTRLGRVVTIAEVIDDLLDAADRRVKEADR